MAGPSVGGKHFIQGAIAQDLHTDGRKRLVYRPISVETGVIPQANGSARVRTGTTDVIASVKGRGGKELSTELSIALQRCLLGSTIGTSTTISNSAAPQRCLLGSKSGTGVGIDCSSLMIAEGKLCWELYVDGLVVSSDGNLLDALGAAIKAALNNTCIPKVYITTAASADDEKPEIDISDEEFLQFDTSGIPVIVTLTKVGSHFIVDATSEEESQMSLAVSISINRNGHICGLTKQGGAGLDHRVILDIISLAKHVSEQ
ncbi:putative exosome complex exonuclease RRP42 isoform X3 [Macadamia integrifolia]|uniref:putative exosome complex exonuclease RRP42 isoform X3 n=1 Tax=Macadamia integrifolia TaxID=60698 RepID=UPI001C4E3409|nr:putative exosome complex exonuclease RRP42 isoform X3 [Macadamia integrifolia]